MDPPKPRSSSQWGNDERGVRSELFFNRELSVLAFNERVLELALDPATPLLERLKFVAICSRNLDEFFEVRAARLKEKLHLAKASRTIDGQLPSEVLIQISAVAHRLVERTYGVLHRELIPAMSKAGVHIASPTETPEVERWALRHAVEKVAPALQVTPLHRGASFPRIANKSLNFLVVLGQGSSQKEKPAQLVVVQIPASLSRVIAVPTELGPPGVHQFVLLSALVTEFLPRILDVSAIIHAIAFRVTRNSQLTVDPKQSSDLLQDLRGAFGRRQFGSTVRLEITERCPARFAGLLLDVFKLQETDLYRVPGPLSLHRLMSIAGNVDRPDLKYRAFRPAAVVKPRQDLFARLRQGSLLLHHPYESFDAIVLLLRQAACDPAVLAIKMTLYRAGADSPIVDALVDSARAGKDVVVVVELQARFDEEANISLAQRLRQAGGNVVYGVGGYKVHAKMLLIVRREAQGLRRYVHLGTGNYHATTARLYTDFGYLTTDAGIGEDVQHVFAQITGMGTPARLKKLLQSPFTLYEALEHAIAREASAARRGRRSRIIMKVNGLSDEGIIRALYEASRAGVPIDLIVRGVCCLRPQVPGLSENIHVRSVLGRFLEHSRVYYFYADGRENVWCGSADLMERNLHRRVEVCFPIQEQAQKQRVLDESLDRYLDETVLAWELLSNQSYRRVPGGLPDRINDVQATLLEDLAEEASVS